MAAMPKFQTFMQDATTFQLQLPKPVTHTRFVDRVRELPDKFNVFRELAPTRLRMRGPEGPCNSAMRTRVGFFGGLVLQGITFATPFAMNGPMVFNSFADFQSKCAAEGTRPKQYFCDQGAYGACNPKRNVELASIYWEALARGKWERFINTRIAPFLECYNFIRCPTSTKSFPEMGPLAAYLLTADLSYSGIVSPPSLDDITAVVYEINKGAASALEKLGLVTPRRGKGKLNRQECRNALEYIHRIVGTILPSDQHAHLCYDYILIEHALCKFSRVSKKNLL
ncbi:hypothetical protein B0H34DRAFT_737229 [Crassisporium funariophilum]|nr:hypothetical protein B0H34DRAFT_737229 [Crassisporium funariophilum]